MKGHLEQQWINWHKKQSIHPDLLSYMGWECNGLVRMGYLTEEQANRRLTETEQYLKEKELKSFWLYLPSSV